MGEYSESTGTFKTEGGLTIYYRSFRADPERARIVIVHGLGEHFGRYTNVMDRLLPKGFSIWGMDLRGHGLSEGARGHVASFDDYISDVQPVVETAAKDRPDSMKCFLLGHSMGGLIALMYGLRFPQSIDGVIASSPALGVRVEVPAAKAVMGKILSAVFPGFSMNNELDASKISHDENVVRAYLDDPLVHDRVSARWFTEILSAMQKTNNAAPSMQVPILLQIAGDDRLVNANSSKAFFQNLAVGDKTLYVYDGLYHEIYNEPEDQRSKVLDDLESWLEAHIKSAPSSAGNQPAKQ